MYWYNDAINEIQTHFNDTPDFMIDKAAVFLADWLKAHNGKQYENAENANLFDDDEPRRFIIISTIEGFMFGYAAGLNGNNDIINLYRSTDQEDLSVDESIAAAIKQFRKDRADMLPSRIIDIAEFHIRTIMHDATQEIIFDDDEDVDSDEEPARNLEELAKQDPESAGMLNKLLYTTTMSCLKAFTYGYNQGESDVASGKMKKPEATEDEYNIVAEVFVQAMIDSFYDEQEDSASTTIAEVKVGTAHGDVVLHVPADMISSGQFYYDKARDVIGYEFPSQNPPENFMIDISNHEDTPDVIKACLYAMQSGTFWSHITSREVLRYNIPGNQLADFVSQMSSAYIKNMKDMKPFQRVSFGIPPYIMMEIGRRTLAALRAYMHESIATVTSPISNDTIDTSVPMLLYHYAVCYIDAEIEYYYGSINKSDTELPDDLQNSTDERVQAIVDGVQTHCRHHSLAPWISVASSIYAANFQDVNESEATISLADSGYPDMDYPLPLIVIAGKAYANGIEDAALEDENMTEDDIYDYDQLSWL